jgi:hypothetical protein
MLSFSQSRETGAITGDTWTQQRRTGSRDLYQGRLTFNVEQAGKYYYPMLTQLDLGLEKTSA